MNDRFISVIVPCWNSAKYLDECINSVLQSTYQYFELILVNDGSSDNTLEICNKYAEMDNRIKIIDQENQGVSVARNNGIDNSLGEFIYFLDSDDLLIMDGLQTLYDMIINNDADICAGRTRDFQSLQELNSFEQEAEANYKQHIYSNEDGVKLCISDDYKIHAIHAALFRKKFINDSRFMIKMRSHEDSYFVFEQMLKAPKLVFTTKPICNYRINPGSASRSDFSDKYKDILSLADLKMQKIQEVYPNLENFENIKIKAYMAVLTNTLKYPLSTYREVEKEAIKYIKQNKKSFIPASKNNKQLFWLVKYNLYYCYKLIYRIKNNKF